MKGLMTLTINTLIDLLKLNWEKSGYKVTHEQIKIGFKIITFYFI
jgi:hypothetical protein